MPDVKEEGKDTIIFVSQEEHEQEKTVVLDEEEEYGLIKPNGDINWGCPCLQGMADGPCGEPFRAAFSCFHYSEAEPKGSDCIPQFKDMQTCFREYPDVYGSVEDEKDVETLQEEGKAEAKSDEKEKDGDTKEDIAKVESLSEASSRDSEVSVENKESTEEITETVRTSDHEINVENRESSRSEVESVQENSANS